MSKRLLNIYGISNSHSQSGAFALILTDTASNKRIPIIIGAFEAQAIAMALEGMKPSRPLTHDLIKNLIESVKVIVKEVYINKFHEGVFYAKIICINENGETFEIDSRTSDAVAIAVRFSCPIYAESDVVEKTSIVMDAGSEEENDENEDVVMETPKSSIEDYTLEELQEILEKAIQSEDFEYAAKLHKEINKRKQGQ